MKNLIKNNIAAIMLKAGSILTAAGIIAATPLITGSYAAAHTTYGSMSEVSFQAEKVYNDSIELGRNHRHTATDEVLMIQKQPCSFDDITTSDAVYSGKPYSGFSENVNLPEGAVTVYFAKDGDAWTAIDSAPKNAGEYKIYLTIPATEGGSAELFFNISPAELTITACDVEVDVGDILPQLTFSSTGLAESDSLDGVISFSHNAPIKDGKLSAAGSYMISVELSTGEQALFLKNYNITTVDGTLTVTEPESEPGPGPAPDPDPDPEPKPTPEPVPYIPQGPPVYIPCTANSNGWSEIKLELLGIAAGGTIEINLNRGYDIPDDIAAIIKERKIKTTFVIDDNRQWFLDGADMVTAMDLDMRFVTHSLKAKMMDTSALRGTAAIKFSLDGTNAPTTISIKLDDANKGSFANLYKYDNGKFELIDSVLLSDDGIAAYSLSEQSSYVIMLDSIARLLEDVNGDGIIDNTDAVAILMDIVNHCENKNIYDVDKNGIVNALDASKILKAINI